MPFKLVERKKVNSYNMNEGEGRMFLISCDKSNCPPFDLLEGRKAGRPRTGLFFLRPCDN